MKLLILKTTDPYINLATEEYLFEHSTDDIFMLWQNEPTVVIGKNQNAYVEINADYVKENKIHIARRITGGGAVYHDLGNINYTFISNKRNEGIDFRYFTLPIIEALRTLDINAELSGRNDLYIGQQKISGNAQYSKGDRVLHHGTLLFNSDLNILSCSLKVDKEKLISKAIKSTRASVTNISSHLNKTISAQEFIDVIKNFIIRKYSPEIISAPNNEIIKSISERNRSEEWLYPDSSFLSSYTVRKKQKYFFGLVDIYLEMKKEVIKKITIIGDFFGTKSISELESMLENKTLSDAEEIIKNVKLNEYIYGMTYNDFVQQIK